MLRWLRSSCLVQENLQPLRPLSSWACDVFADVGILWPCNSRNKKMPNSTQDPSKLQLNPSTAIRFYPYSNSNLNPFSWSEHNILKWATWCHQLIDNNCSFLPFRVGCFNCFATLSFHETQQGGRWGEQERKVPWLFAIWQTATQMSGSPDLNSESVNSVDHLRWMRFTDASGGSSF